MVMVTTVRHPGFKSCSCRFSLFSFLPKQVGFQRNLYNTVHVCIYVSMYTLQWSLVQFYVLESFLECYARHIFFWFLFSEPLSQVGLQGELCVLCVHHTCTLYVSTYRTCAHVHTHMHVHMYVVHTHARACTHMNTHGNICANTCRNIHTHTHTYTYTHTHTHIHL